MLSDSVMASGVDSVSTVVCAGLIDLGITTNYFTMVQILEVFCFCVYGRHT